MSKGLLIWSFEKLENMDRAIAAIRTRWTGVVVRGQIDGNVYWTADPKDADYAAGLCRGVAFVTQDASIGDQ